MHSSGHDGVALQIHARAYCRRRHRLADGRRNRYSRRQLCHRSGRDCHQLPRCRSCIRVPAKARSAPHAIPFAKLRQSHVADHQSLYRRVSLDLGQSPAASRQLPTDARRKALENGADDPELLALFFQYGRYLTIAGSRADSPLPLALQGIWNDGLASSMGWTDDFHLDINTQQNYWPAEVCNLSECQTPLFALIDGMRAAGRTTAREMYNAPGWVVHTVTNPWGYTAPGRHRLGHLRHRGHLDRAADVGPLHLQRRCRVPAHARLSRAARGCALLPRLHGARTEARMAGHRPLRFTGELVQDALRRPRGRIHGQHH